MKTYTAKDAKNRFGQLIDDVRSGPVWITRNGREVAVMISARDAERLDHLGQRLEHKYWSDRITEAEEGGYLSFEESNKILEEGLKDMEDVEKREREASLTYEEFVRRLKEDGLI